METTSTAQLVNKSGIIRSDHFTGFLARQGEAAAQRRARVDRARSNARAREAADDARHKATVNARKAALQGSIARLGLGDRPAYRPAGGFGVLAVDTDSERSKPARLIRTGVGAGSARDAVLGDMYVRQLEWKAAIVGHRAALAADLAEREVSECTFKPASFVTGGQGRRCESRRERSPLRGPVVFPPLYPPAPLMQFGEPLQATVDRLDEAELHVEHALSALGDILEHAVWRSGSRPRSLTDIGRGRSPGMEEEAGRRDAGSPSPLMGTAAWKGGHESGHTVAFEQSGATATPVHHSVQKDE